MFKRLSAYIVTYIILVFITITKYDSTNLYFSINYNYKFSKDILLFFTLIFFSITLLIKTEKSFFLNFKKVIPICILFFICAMILYLNYDFVKSTIYRSTVNMDFLTPFIYLFIFPLYFFIIYPLINNDINPIFILLLSIYPPLILLISSEFKRLLKKYKKKHM